MRRILIALVAVSAAVATMGLAAPTGAVAAKSAPRWVKHVTRYPGGISGTPRSYLDPKVTQLQGRYRQAVLAAQGAGNKNVQMNDDSYPPLPQNETSVAYDTDEPLIAVAASNDYVSGGVAIMRTADGGKSWKTIRVVPQFRGTGDYCTGGDPSVAYSLRDDAFYVAQLCFFRALPYSEVQLYKSINDGKTWTPGRQSALAASNFDYNTGQVDPSIFNDKEYITVDNYPTSPHYGRIYVTYTKFHIQDDGFSDYCPIQLSYTDDIPTINPRLAVFQHVAVVPDNPGGDGKGPSADQFSVPVVEKSGALDIAYLSEACNTSVDYRLLFQKSVNGGVSFLPNPVQVNKKGQWKDNSSKSDLLTGGKKFRAPNTVSLAWSPKTGTLGFMYTNYIDQANSGGNIGVSLSHDGGLTWSDTKNVSTSGNAPAQNDQWFPWIASDPAGNFYAIWFDCREDPNNHMINTFQAKSADDGGTWPNVKISTKDWDPDLGFFTSGAFIGDYNGLAASSVALYPVWTDGRNSAIGQTGIGETDIFTNG